MLKTGERLEHLGNGVCAIVSGEHTFGEDAVLLADFSRPRAGRRLCDLGTGCGIIPLLWCVKGGPYRRLDAFELQPDAADLARRAAEQNGLAIRVFNADLRNIDSSFSDGYDLVACNPPYYKACAGPVSAGGAAAAARHEAFCTLGDVAEAAARLLVTGGRLCLCHRPERAAEILALLHSHGIEPKRLRFVQHSRAKKPWLMLVEGMFGARPGLEVLPVLLATGEDGAVSPEMRAIYGDYGIH